MQDIRRYGSADGFFHSTGFLSSVFFNSVTTGSSGLRVWTRLMEFGGVTRLTTWCCGCAWQKLNVYGTFSHTYVKDTCFPLGRRAS